MRSVAPDMKWLANKRRGGTGLAGLRLGDWLGLNPCSTFAGLATAHCPLAGLIFVLLGTDGQGRGGWGWLAALPKVFPFQNAAGILGHFSV
jgi:hypothetical protein